MEVYKKGAMAKVNQGEVTGDEGCGQPPPDRASLRSPRLGVHC